jgi:hypothetical protein
MLRAFLQQLWDRGIDIWILNDAAAEAEAWKLASHILKLLGSVGFKFGGTQVEG